MAPPAGRPLSEFKFSGWLLRVDEDEFLFITTKPPDQRLRIESQCPPDYFSDDWDRCAATEQCNQYEPTTMGSTITTSRPKIAPKDSGLLERWPGRDNIALFVHCLHLLDLDLLEDWPQITAQTLSTRSPSQNLQQRVKAVEWSLYRLCELYDAHLARDKLRPFFPPQSQLQSQNLRAALLRVLTDLKKTGILGKDVVLRKTTFDECKGDKFQELLAGFANLVLRQRIRLGSNSALCSGTSLNANRLSLVIAHRVSIRTNLEKRQALRKRLLDHEQHITARRSQLLEAKKHLQRQKALNNDALEIAERPTRESWAADTAWLDALLQGFPPGEGLLQRVDTRTCEHEPTAKLQELQAFTVEQDARLQRWKTFKSCLPTRNAERRRDEHCSSLSRSHINLNRHQLLRPEESTQRKLQNDEEMCKIRTSHQELLLRLSNELNSSTPPYRNHRANIARASRRYPQDWQQSPGYNQSDACEPAAFADSKSCPSTRDTKQEAQATGSVMFDLDNTTQPSPVPPSSEPEVSSPESSWIPGNDLSSRGDLPSENSRATSAMIEAEKHGSYSPPTTPLPKTPLNLQERTRMSLAGALRDLDNLSSSPMVRIQESPIRDENVDTPQPVPVKNAENLAQRTRKSMSLLTTIADMKTNNHRSKGRRISQLYPINPFETPRKSSPQIDVHTPGSNDSTPRETLFSDEADMSSVFKSRPKIAMSPMMSPDRSILEEDSILASRAGDIKLDDASDGGSPY